MSILIKGMEMPKSCYDCDMLELSGVVRCNHAYDTKNSVWGRALNCPLIELPPHGRLIDADALEVQNGWLRDSKYFAQESSHTHITFVYSNDIYNAPTVIPADKDGET